MKNYVAKGEKVEYTNAGAAITSGSVVVAACFVGVAETDIAATTGVGTVCIEGVFTLGKTAGLAIAQGDKLYFNTTTKLITKTNTDPAIGGAHSAALAGDSTVDVNLYGLMP